MTTASPSLRRELEPENVPLLSREGWVWTVAIGALFALIYYSFLIRMGRVAWENTDWSHIPLIPVFSLIFVVQRKKEILACPARIFWPGLLLLLGGIFGFALGIYPGRNDMIQGYSMILALFGLVLFLQGPGRMKILWFPVLYLVFAVAISQRYWEMIAFEMQLLAAVIATGVIQIIGLVIDLDATVTGARIDLYVTGAGGLPERQNPFMVEEACSGLRMLMTFLALGVAIAFVSTHRRWWQRLIIVASTVPVAMLVNVLRVVVIAVLSTKVSEELGRGDAHIAIGMTMLIPAALIFLLLGWVLDKLVIYDPAQERARLRRRQAPAQPLEPASPSRLSLDGLKSAWSGEQPRDVGAGQSLPGLLRACGRSIACLLRDNREVLKAAFAGLRIGVALLLVGAAGAFGLYLLVSEMLAALGQPVNAIRIGAGLALIGGAGFAAAIPLHWRLNLPTGRPGARELGIVCGVLLAAAVGLNGAVQAMQLALDKKPVPIRRPLDSLPRQVGPWSWEAERDERLGREMEQQLGTQQYIMRQYIYRGDGDGHGSQGILLHVTYYTGSVSVVPHVPERCFVGGGFRPVGRGVVGLSVEGDQYAYNEDSGTWEAVFDEDRDAVTIPSMDMRASVFRFEDPDFRGQVQSVFYFFAANGRFFATPDQVRAEAFNPRDRYSYHAKIEMMPLGFSSESEGREAVEDFLSRMLPHVMAALPDWEAVKRGEWPPEAQEAR